MTRYDLYAKTEINKQIVCRKDKWGVIDEDGEEIIPLAYDNVGYYPKGEVFVVGKGKYDYRTGIFDINGKELLPAEYSLLVRIAYFRNIFIIQQNDKYGLFNPTLGKVIDCKFDYIYPIDFGDSIVGVKLNNKYGIYTITGKEVVPVIYTQLIYIYSGYFSCKKNGKYGLLNIEGVELIPCKYDKEVKKINDFVICFANGKYGLLKLDGTEILPCEYDDISYLVSKTNYFLITKNKKLGIASDKGEIISPSTYSHLSFGYDDNIITCINCKWGVMDLDGNEIIPNIYSSIKLFDGNYKIYLVRINNYKYGLINSKGTVIVEPKYYSIEERTINGFCVVSTGLGKEGLINEAGEEIFPPVYQSVRPIAVCNKSHEIIYNYTARESDDLQTNLVIIRENGKYGIRKTNGQILLLSKYDQIHKIYEEYAEVELNEHNGIAYFEH